MSDRTRNEKPFAQDATGILFCLVGGFFAVSIVLFLRGQEPKPGLVTALTWPVVELVARLGSLAALSFSIGLAVLGSVLFLRPSPFVPLRPIGAILVGALGVAVLAGAFGGGGELGAWLPGLVAGFFGRALTVLLGAALGWLSWSMFFAARAPRSSSADVLQRIGLSARQDAAAGVSPAEAALLVTEPRSPEARPAPRREETRQEALRPFSPARGTRASESRGGTQSAGVSPQSMEKPARAAAATQTRVEPLPAPREAPVSVLTPPTPSWEQPEDAAQDAAGDDEGLAREADKEALAAAFLTSAPASPVTAASFERLQETGEEQVEGAENDPAEEDDEADEFEALAEAFETEEELLVEPSEELGEPAAVAPPTAAWEQIGLFDEEELEEEALPGKTVKVELTPSFDFAPDEPRRPAHEPEETVHTEDPFAGPPVGLPGAVLERAPAHPEPEEEPKEEAVRPVVEPTPRQDFTLKPVSGPAPKPASKSSPRPAPAVASEGDEERWSQLIFEAGCVILEQKRVAVSMLERRFSLDFDKACRVLDELQAAGLIGPYMGGRTRDILLTREEWQPHAPHAS